jgi:hypothetical protein
MTSTLAPRARRLLLKRHLWLKSILHGFEDDEAGLEDACSMYLTYGATDIIAVVDAEPDDCTFDAQSRGTQ